MSVTVIYGSDNGTTENIAKRIANKLQGKAVNISSASSADFEGADLLVLGSPTYGMGNLQPDWEDNLDKLQGANLQGRKVALFGLGDQSAYPDTYVDAMGLLYDEVVAKGATVVGATSTSGYDFTESLAKRDGKFVGLALDEESQSSKTDDRLEAWLGQIQG